MTINGKEYEIKMNLGRARLVEKALDGESVTHALLGNEGMMSLTALTTFWKYGLKEVGADAFVAPAEAITLCETYMEEHGYTAAVNEVQRAVGRDMGFLFRLA